MNPGDKSNDLPAKLVVRKPFAFADINYKIGDVFDRGSMSDRRVRQLWDQRKLGTEAELQRDRDRADARRGVEVAAKLSARAAVDPEIVVPDPVVEEPVTAEDYDL